MQNIPTVTKNLLIINVIVFVAQYIFQNMGVQLDSMFGLHFFLASHFSVYQLFTYMFLHGGFTHLFFNMFALWMFGCVIERVWGARRFLFYYITCGVGAGIIQEVAQFAELFVMNPQLSFADAFNLPQMAADSLNLWRTIGASGAVYAILLAFGMTFPNERIFIFPLPVPIKAKWFVVFYAGVELFMALGSSNDGVAHMAHLGGMFFGYLLIRYWRKHPYNTYYNINSGTGLFSRMRQNYEQYRRNNVEMTVHKGGAPADNKVRTETDEEYNARKKAEQDIIDSILDKIRKSGYDSLTAEEKRRLFELSHKDD